MSHTSTTAIHHVTAAIWSPEMLRQSLGTTPNNTNAGHTTVVLDIPLEFIERVADNTLSKTCAVVELRGRRLNMRYDLLTIQSGAEQLVVVGPLASAFIRDWLREGTRPDGRYRFLTASHGTDVMTAVNVPFLGDESGAAPFRASLDVALGTATRFTPQEHFSDFAKVTKIAELKGESASLLDGYDTRDRYVAVIVPPDWPGLAHVRAPSFAAIIVQ